MKKLIPFALLVFSCSTIYSQQWAGSSTTTGMISRDAMIIIGGTTASGSWGNNGQSVVEIQHIPGSTSFLALRQQGSNATSMDIGFKANEYAGIYANKVPLNFWTGDVNGGGTRMTITPSGNIGIGTTTPGSFKLAVEGKIGAREIKVTLDNPWPDYVFDKEYPLLDILSLEKYITINKHLPGIPSAKEITENKGFEVGQMTTKLLEKIEELTLYIIKLKKEIDEIKLKLN